MPYSKRNREEEEEKTMEREARLRHFLDGVIAVLVLLLLFVALVCGHSSGTYGSLPWS